MIEFHCYRSATHILGRRSRGLESTFVLLGRVLWYRGDWSRKLHERLKRTSIRCSCTQQGWDKRAVEIARAIFKSLPSGICRINLPAVMTPVKVGCDRSEACRADHPVVGISEGSHRIGFVKNPRDALLRDSVLHYDGGRQALTSGGSSIRAHISPDQHRSASEQACCQVSCLATVRVLHHFDPPLSFQAANWFGGDYDIIEEANFVPAAILHSTLREDAYCMSNKISPSSGST